MLIRHFFTPGLSINTYLVFDEETRRGALIDPTRNVETFLLQASRENVQITDILETHVHADFISGATELKSKLDHKPIIHCSGMGGAEWIPHYADHIVSDRDCLSIGSIRLEAWHTPGHTPEHMMWVAYDEKRNPKIPELAFTGDLLFVGSVGRPDLLGKAEEVKLSKQLYESLFDKLKPLPDFLEIFPAHGSDSLCGKQISKRESSTLGYERQTNPLLIHTEFNKWHDLLRTNIPKAPHYFKRMKQLNISGCDIFEKEPPIINEERLLQLQSSCIIIDIRDVQSFSISHLKGSINIPFLPSFPLWAGMMISEDKQIVLIADQLEVVLPAIHCLNLIGIPQVKGVYLAGQGDFQKNHDHWIPFSLITPKALMKELDHYTIIDVRTPTEWHSGHIAGAKHIELAEIPYSLKKLPTNKPIAVICHSGNRASIAASFLVRENINNIKNVSGGMSAWIKELG